MKISGVILAGGKSSRMGTDKAMVYYKDKLLIDYAIETLTPIVSNIYISSNNLLQEDFLPHTVVKDVYTECGPMAGIHACMHITDADFVAVLSCDTPHVNSKCFKNLIDKCSGFDAVVARHSKNKIEPLIALYSIKTFRVIESCLELNAYKIQDFIKMLHVKYVDFDNSDLFYNCNEPKDLI